MKKLLTIMAMAIAVPASAQTDSRIREVSFRPGTVYTLRVAVGYVATVALSPDERIQSVAIGNSSAWEVTPSKSGDHLFVRPMATGTPTNLEVVTDSRHYSLVLQTTFEGDPEALFQLRFGYGAPSAAAVAAAGPMPTGPGNGAQSELPPQPDSIMAMPSPDAPTAGAISASVDYRITGDKLARPVLVSDDGSRTLFVFDDDAPLPAVYAIDEQEQETLVTMRLVEQGWMVDRVWPEYKLRVGKSTARVVRNIGGSEP